MRIEDSSIEHPNESILKEHDVEEISGDGSRRELHQLLICSMVELLEKYGGSRRARMLIECYGRLFCSGARMPIERVGWSYA